MDASTTSFSPTPHSEYQLILSAQEPKAEPARSLACKLWGVDWTRHYPVRLTSSATVVEATSFGQVAEFLKQNIQAIYRSNQEDQAFLFSGQHAAKSAFYEECSDSFVFRSQQDGRVIGVFIGNVLDWSSYYLRYTAILPEFRRQGIFAEFVEGLVEVLKAYPVERVEADVSPNNHPQVHLLNRVGFNLSGTLLTERWGALSRFTKYMKPANQAVFLNQFCVGDYKKMDGSPNK
ncbi:MAG: GNAT family N-acetyltransferase [Bdellovibrionota bacterium]